MTLAEIIVGAVVALAVAEFTEVSPWLARRLVRWSAHVRYVEANRADVRAEELEALVNERPGRLFKLGTGMRFAASAAIAYVRRHIWGGEPVEASDDGPLEDLPSTLVARYLFPTERYRGEWKRHWFHLFKAWLFGTAYAGLAVWGVALRIKPQYKPWFIVGIVVWYLLWLIYRLANWYFTRFVITNRRLMSTEGLITRRVGTIPLVRVTDLRYEQSPMGRLLNYGSFRLESASRANMMRVIKDLPNPNELYLRVIEEMYEPAAVENRLKGLSGDDVDLTEGNASDVDSQTTDSTIDIGTFTPDLPQQVKELSKQIRGLAEAIQTLRRYSEPE